MQITKEQNQTLSDVCYLINQMLYAYKFHPRINNLIFLYENGYTQNNYHRLTPDEIRFLKNANLETFLSSFRNLLDFFHRPIHASKAKSDDTRAFPDFAFPQKPLISNADDHFRKVSKHLSHLTSVRKTRVQNLEWNLNEIIEGSKEVLIEFMKHCLTRYQGIDAITKDSIDGIINYLSSIGSNEHFIAHLHASASPMMLHSYTAVTAPTHSPQKTM